MDISRRFHTFFGDYEGHTDEDVLRAVYADSQRITGRTYEEWWRHQQTLWKAKYDIDVPAQEAKGSASSLLAVLLRVGALEPGSRQPHEATP